MGNNQTGLRLHSVIWLRPSADFSQHGTKTVIQTLAAACSILTAAAKLMTEQSQDRSLEIKLGAKVGVKLIEVKLIETEVEFVSERQLVADDLLNVTVDVRGRLKIK